jgi:hypothetical protein
MRNFRRNLAHSTTLRIRNFPFRNALTIWYLPPTPPPARSIGINNLAENIELNLGAQ